MKHVLHGLCCVLCIVVPIAWTGADVQVIEDHSTPLEFEGGVISTDDPSQTLLLRVIEPSIGICIRFSSIEQEREFRSLLRLAATGSASDGARGALEGQLQALARRGIANEMHRQMVLDLLEATRLLNQIDADTVLVRDTLDETCAIATGSLWLKIKLVVKGKAHVGKTCTELKSGDTKLHLTECTTIERSSSDGKGGIIVLVEPVLG
jgi:hypothetical protein